MKKLLLGSTLLLASLSAFATPSPVSGTYKGVVKKAIGATRQLNGSACTATIDYTQNGAMNVQVLVNGNVFGANSLIPKLGGSNLYEPKWVPQRAGSNSLVVFVHPTLPETLTSISLFKTNMSEQGYDYSLNCEIQEIDWDVVSDNFSAGYKY